LYYFLQADFKTFDIFLKIPSKLSLFRC